MAPLGRNGAHGRNAPLFAEIGRSSNAALGDSRAPTPFLGALARLPILDSKLVIAHEIDSKFGEMGGYGEAYLSDHDAGSGAYMLVNHVPENETNLAKFDGYRDPHERDRDAVLEVLDSG